MAYNILRELLKREDIELELYANLRNYPCVKEVLTTCAEFKQCKITDCYTTIAKLILHLEYLKFENKVNSGNFVKKLLIKFVLNFLKSVNRINGGNLLSASKCAENYDAYLTPLYGVPKELKDIKSLKRFMIVHDLIPLLFPQYFKGADTGNYFFFEILKTLNKEDYYIANSEYTKQDFIKHVPQIDSEKISTALLAASENFHEVTSCEEILKAREKYNIPNHKKYLFSLCSLEERKNLIHAVKAFILFIEKHNIDNLVYVLGGGAWDGFVEKLEGEIPDYSKYKDKIIRAGYVDDEDLSALYSGAEFFVYTSEYEGFGLPPLEAMQCGMAVITSNNSSLPEVVGDAGIMIDFDSIEQHVEAYEKLYFDEDFRKLCKQKSLIRAQNFSWSKTADVIVQTIKNVVEK